jgi:hypothetical protein
LIYNQSQRPSTINQDLFKFSQEFTTFIGSNDIFEVLRRFSLILNFNLHVL